jgi:hypothetical protein
MSDDKNSNQSPPPPPPTQPAPTERPQPPRTVDFVMVKKGGDQSGVEKR